MLSQITLKGFILVSKGDLSAVLRELPNHIALTRKEKGCLAFEVLQDSDDIYRFNVYEVFVDQKAFEQHQSRVKNTTWVEITINVERHYKTSEL